MIGRLFRTAMALVALLPAMTVGCATPSPSAANGALTLTVENDVLTGSDNNYTNGVGVSWVSASLDGYEDDGFLRRWGDFWAFLPFVGDEGHKTYAAWSLAQEMHTPDDITLRNPPRDDQPYAGVLYLDNILYARSERWAHAWELKLGTVGPSSQAEGVQKWFHERIGADEPKGWRTQLPNEPVINVGFTTAHLWKSGPVDEAAEWRLVPVGHAALGNYFTGVGLGLYEEIGWNPVDALGGTALREGLNAASTVGVGPVDGWSFSLFAGVAGHAVAHYLPLDGTVFRDSRSVDTKPLVGSASIGFSLRSSAWVLSLAVTTTSDAFDGQKQSAEFGTLSLSYLF